MKILVKFDSERTVAVRAEELQELIHSGKILSFRRNDDEWVQIGVGPIRGMGGRYRGTGAAGKRPVHVKGT